MARLRFEPDAATVAFDDLLTDSQSQAGAGILAAPMKPLEDREHLIGIAHIDADAVVAYREPPHAVLPDHLDINAWREMTVKLDGIANQVLKYVLKLRGIGQDSRQPSPLDNRAAFLDSHTQVCQRALEGFTGIDRRLYLCVRPNP